jgi:hypothetical protein
MSAPEWWWRLVGVKHVKGVPGLPAVQPCQPSRKNSQEVTLVP